MIKYSKLTINELLELESDWWEREEETNRNWINEGIRIFTNLSMKDRYETRYKETLAYLLILQGEFMKIKDHSFERAIKVFRQVIRLEPENAIAHYRLGFLYFYEEKWSQSIDAFYQATHSEPKQSRKRLTKEQEVKAHYYILRNSKIISQEILNKVDDIPSKDLELFSELNLLVESMKEGLKVNEEHKPYQMIVNGQEYSEISEGEYDLLIDLEDNRFLIFNQVSMNHTIVALKGKEVSIPLKQVAILEFLMRHPKGVSKREMVSRLANQSRDPQAALRQTISRLRTRLKGLNPTVDFIKTIEGGYCWSWEGEYRMFKHYRDVGSDLLLD